MFFLPAKSQSNDECRYLMALTYLRTNTQINEEIKGLFSRIKLIKKKDKFVEFHLSNRVDFLSITGFKEDLDSTNFGIGKELINNYKLYHEKYFFESFRSEFLRRIAEPNESKLFLTFSKPVENYLVAEIGNFDPELYQTKKFGLGMKIFFKFDSSGLIENVLYARSAYN